MCVLSCVRLSVTLWTSSPGSSVHGISQARILDWVAIFFSRESSWPRDWTWVFCISCIASGFFTSWAIGFSSSHVLDQIWELDHKEGWVQKNWCFQIVLEKTLESPLDCKEIKPVTPEANESWIFIGKTDTEGEAPILWPPDAKSQLIGQDPDSGKDWGQEEKGATEDEKVGWHYWLDLSMSKFWKIVKDRETWLVQFHGVTKSWIQLSSWTKITQSAPVWWWSVSLFIIHRRAQ